MINSKEASEKACEIWLKLRLHKDMATFQTMQTWTDHVVLFEKLPYPLVSCNFSHFERVTTHYQILKIWIGLNVTRYHNLNALPHALLHALPYIFYKICLVLGYLQRVNIIFLKKH